jgi:hypothetical protein
MPSFVRQLDRDLPGRKLYEKSKSFGFDQGNPLASSLRNNPIHVVRACSGGIFRRIGGQAVGCPRRSASNEIFETTAFCSDEAMFACGVAGTFRKPCMRPTDGGYV